MKMKMSKAMFAVLAALGVSACSNKDAQEHKEVNVLETEEVNVPEKEEVKPEKIVLTDEQSELINDKLDLIMVALSRKMGRNVTQINSITFDENSGITLDLKISDYNARKDTTTDVNLVAYSTTYVQQDMQEWNTEVAALAGHYAGNNIEGYTNLIGKQLKTIKNASEFTYSTATLNNLDVSSISSKLVLQKLCTRYTEDGNFAAAEEIINFLKNNPNYSANPSASWTKVENAEKTGFDYMASFVVTANGKNYIYSFKFAGDEDKTEVNMVEALKAYFTNEASALKAELIEIKVEEVAKNFVYVEETELIATATAWLKELNTDEEKGITSNV